MCFSASASFTASAVLSMIGFMALGQCRRDVHKLPAATIPLLFGLQQAAEGMVWLGFYQQQSALILFFSYLFLTIAMVGWPVMVPYALYMLEQQEARKNLLKMILFLGLVLAASLCGALILVPLHVGVQEHHIVYDIPIALGWTWLATLLYIVATVVPLFISTKRFVWLFGVLLTGSYLVSYYFYAYAHISIWCFMAALLSVLILVLLTDKQLRR